MTQQSGDDDDNIEVEADEEEESTDDDTDDSSVDLDDEEDSSKKKKRKMPSLSRHQQRNEEHWKPNKISKEKLMDKEEKFFRQVESNHRERILTNNERVFLNNCNKMSQRKEHDLLAEFVSGLKSNEILWFTPIYSQGITSISNMFDENFIDFTSIRSSKPTRFHRRYPNSNNINYYRPTVDKLKSWIKSHPPTETIVDILILQEYIQEVLKGMFSDEFGDERLPDKFYTNISYIAFRHNEAFDRINSELRDNDTLNQLWDDQFAIKVGATNDFDRFMNKMKRYITCTSNGVFYCIGIGILPGSGFNHYKLEQLLQFELIEDWESGEWFKRIIRNRLISILKKLGFIIIFKGSHRVDKIKPIYTRHDPSHIPNTLYLIKPNIDDAVNIALNSIYNYHNGGDNEDVGIKRYVNCIIHECKFGCTSEWDARKRKYIWTRSNSKGWIGWILRPVNNAHLLEESFGDGIIESGESMADKTIFGRWETREWVLLRQNQMEKVLKDFKEQACREEGEIEGPIPVTRDQRKLVAAVNMRAADVQLYIVRGYFTDDYLKMLLCGNKYKLTRHKC
jgi:hypothetical protein